MNTHTKELAELLDREKIRDCLARSARGEDRRNAELITAPTCRARSSTTASSPERSMSTWPGSSQDRPTSR
jgi:hypothetical protein